MKLASKEIEYKRKSLMKRYNKLGLTLVETLFALAIFAFLSVGFMTTLVASMRTTGRAVLEIAADNFATKIIEEMQIRNKMSIEEYDKLGDPSAPENDSFLKVFVSPSDPQNLSRSVEFRAQVQFKGFGKVESAAQNSLTAVIPNGFPSWDVNEWKDCPVMIKKGKGSGQIAYILSNSSNSLSITRNLDGSAGTPWLTNPDSSSYFEINGGKTAEVTVRWVYRGHPFTRVYRTLVYHP